MKPALLVPLALVLGAAAGAATSLLVRPTDARAAVATPTDGELERAVAALRTRIDALEARRAGDVALAPSAAPSPASAARVPAEDLEALVTRLLDERAAGAEGDASAAARGASAASAAQGASGDALDAQALLAELVDPATSDAARQELWQRAAQQGRLDELVALFEERAAQRPNDPVAQVDLGQAYLQKVFESNGPAAGKWAMNADRSFDAALALDERHWDARFSKAVSLSFWPPALGKQGEAIKHFETLVAQQEQSSPAAKHAQTYLMLGNTYQQIGDQAKALAAWQKGAALYPDDAALAQQIANAGGH